MVMISKSFKIDEPANAALERLADGGSVSDALRGALGLLGEFGNATGEFTLAAIKSALANELRRRMATHVKPVAVDSPRLTDEAVFDEFKKFLSAVRYDAGMNEPNGEPPGFWLSAKPDGTYAICRRSERIGKDGRKELVRTTTDEAWKAAYEIYVLERDAVRERLAEAEGDAE